MKYPNFLAKIAKIFLTFAASMETMYLDRVGCRPLPCVATIGFFDGVHLGHRHLVSEVMKKAHDSGLASMVVTFARHPRQVLQSDWRPQLLSTFAEKSGLLSQTGVDCMAVLPFDANLASLPAREFMSEVLCRQLGVRTLVIGYDNHFGHRVAGSTEGFADYVEYGQQLGIRVCQCSPFDAGGIRVSSSKVRQQLAAGDVHLAARCLGRFYELSGSVVSGEHVGTSLGFPTANLRLFDPDKLLPASGAYAVKIRIAGCPELLNGMMNIGCRPTFHGDRQTLEVHIFHFDGNLYGREMSVSFVSRLRPELTFDGAEALAVQLAADARQAESILEHYAANLIPHVDNSH